MKLIKDYFCRCSAKEGFNFVELKGRHLHWLTTIIPFSWIYFIYLIFSYPFIWIFYGLFSIILSYILLLGSGYVIRINRDFIEIKLIFFFYPYKIIRSKTSDLIIDHIDAKEIKVISLRKDYYSEDIKPNLRFDFGGSFDDNNNYLTIYHKNKEVDLEICYDDVLWKEIIKALKNSDHQNKNFS